MDIKEVKNFIETLNQDNIEFDIHFYKRARERPVNESIVRKFLFQLKKLEKIEKGRGERRFKLWFKMSRKYSLVLIIEIDSSKSLKVISAWNSNRKWQRKLS